MRELEVQRDVVNGQEEDRGRCRHGNVEQNLMHALEKLYREDLVFRRGEETELLLDDKSDKAQAPNCDHGNPFGRIPCPLDATEREGHNKQNKDGDD